MWRVRRATECAAYVRTYSGRDLWTAYIRAILRIGAHMRCARVCVCVSFKRNANGSCAVCALANLGRRSGACGVHCAWIRYMFAIFFCLHEKHIKSPQKAAAHRPPLYYSHSLDVHSTARRGVPTHTHKHHAQHIFILFKQIEKMISSLFVLYINMRSRNATRQKGQHAIYTIDTFILSLQNLCKKITVSCAPNINFRNKKSLRHICDVKLRLYIELRGERIKKLVMYISLKILIPFLLFPSSSLDVRQASPEPTTTPRRRSPRAPFCVCLTARAKQWPRLCIAHISQVPEVARAVSDPSNSFAAPLPATHQSPFCYHQSASPCAALALISHRVNFASARHSSVELHSVLMIHAIYTQSPPLNLLEAIVGNAINYIYISCR